MIYILNIIFKESGEKLTQVYDKYENAIHALNNHIEGHKCELEGYWCASAKIERKNDSYAQINCTFEDGSTELITYYVHTDEIIKDGDFYEPLVHFYS